MYIYMTTNCYNQLNIMIYFKITCTLYNKNFNIYLCISILVSFYFLAKVLDKAWKQSEAQDDLVL